jgi:hypothetical protein
MRIWLLTQRNVESVRYPIEALYIDLPLRLTHDPCFDSSRTTDIEQVDQPAQDGTPNNQFVEQSVPSQILQKIESIDGVDVEQVNRQLRGNHASARFVDSVSLRQLLQPPKLIDCKISTQLEQGARLVIVGDPGCGKTTLLSFLAYSYACSHPLTPSHVKYSTNISENRSALPSQIWIPVTLLCRDLLAADFDGNLLSLIEYQLKKDYRDIPRDVPLLINLIEREISEGQILLLIDGIDEIKSSEKRQKFAQLIDNIYSKIPIVITSRVVGFNTIKESLSSFKYINVLSLEIEEKKQFVQNWAKCTGGTSLVNTLEPLVCGDRRVADLCGNIFLLSVIVQLALEGDILLSDRRVDVYSRAVDLMIKRRPIFDDRYDNKPNNEIVPHLEYLAYHMHLDGLQKWWDSRVIEAIEEFYENEATSRKIKRYSPERWLELVLNHIGLLTIAGGSMDEKGIECDEVQFFHQSFQEYFAAQALLNGRGISDGTTFLERLRRLVHESEITESNLESLGLGTKAEPEVAESWQEVIRLCISSLKRKGDVKR